MLTVPQHLPVHSLIQGYKFPLDICSHMLNVGNLEYQVLEPMVSTMRVLVLTHIPSHELWQFERASSRSPNQPYRNLFIHCVSRGRCDVLAHILNSPQFTDRMQLSLLRNVCEHWLFLLINRWQSISFCCRSKNKWDRSTLEKSPPKLTPN